MIWKQTGRQNYSSQQRDGSRYLIDKLGESWVLSYLPTGTALTGGRERVEWTPGRQSLTNAKLSCETHAASKAE
jgi:hypothetical protein